MVQIMKFILPIVYLVSHVFCEHRFVLTKFKGIEKFAVKSLLHKWRNDTDAIKGKTCEDLFDARGFEITENRTSTHPNVLKMNDEQFTLHQHKIEDNEDYGMTREFNLLRQSRKVHLQIFQCYDYKGEKTRIVTYTKPLRTGFLFQETTPNQSPKLTAVIDSYYSGSILTKSYNSFNYARYGPRLIDGSSLARKTLELWFLESYDNQMALNQKDVLCNSDDITQFRVCSIGADALHRTKRHKNTYRKVGDQEYEKEEQFMNFYHQPNRTDNRCPKVKIQLDDNAVSMAPMVHEFGLLYCDVSVQGTEYQFYLSTCTQLRSGQIFILEKTGPSTGLMHSMIEVPLVAFLTQNYYIGGFFSGQQ